MKFWVAVLALCVSLFLPACGGGDEEPGLEQNAGTSGGSGTDSGEDSTDDDGDTADTADTGDDTETGGTGVADDTEPTAETTGSGDDPVDDTSGWDIPPELLDPVCTEPIQIPLEADDAELNGWDITQSQFPGEDNVIFPAQGGGPDASAMFSVEVPCQDTWTVWVRGRDQGSDDSHFVQVDGEPNPPLIFEVDCSGGGDDYKWTRLNQRELDAPVCVHVTDPWDQEWEKGVHQITFYPREPGAVSRLIVTNDPGFDPGSIE